MKKKAASKRAGRVYLLYARVSPKGSTWDAEETSIAVQLHECREYVLKRDPAAQFLEVTDEMKSGKNLERPGIQRVIAGLESGSGEWDCLVVWHLDRLTRSLTDALPLFKKIRDADKGFMSVRQEIDMFTAGGRFMLHIFISTAEYEREMTSERVSAKMHGIAQQGKIPWGNIPFGYRRRKDAKNTLEPNPETASMVPEIFKMYLSGGFTFEEIQKKFEGRFKYRNHVYRILRCRMYTGEFEYDGEIYHGEHEPLIDKETFERVQTMLPEKGGYHKSRPGAQKYKYLLAGMVKCHCGNCMTTYSAISRGNRFFYYKCTNPACKNAVSAPALDNEVLDQIKATVRNKDTMRRVFDDYERDVADELLRKQPEVAELDRAIADAEKKERRIADIFTSGIVTTENMEFWNKELKAATDMRADLEKRRAEFKISMPETPPEGFFDEFQKKMTEWASSLDVSEDDNALKRTLVGAILQDVVCTKKNQFKMKLVLTKCLKWWATCNLVITILMDIDGGRQMRYAKMKKPGTGVRAWL